MPQALRVWFEKMFWGTHKQAYFETSMAIQPRGYPALWATQPKTIETPNPNQNTQAIFHHWF